MGVILTVVTHQGAEDSFHVGCGHREAAYSWHVSDDGRWLVVKSLSGVPREHVPMVGIRRLLVESCGRPAEVEKRHEKCPGCERQGYTPPRGICIPKLGEDPTDHAKHDHIPGEREFFSKPCSCGETTIPYGEGRVTTEESGLQKAYTHGIDECYQVPF